MCGERVLRLLAAHLRIGDLTHTCVCDVAGVLRVQRHSLSPLEDVVIKQRALIQLNAEVIARRNERMHRALIARNPRREHNREDHARSDRPGEAALQVRPSNVEQARRKDEQQRSIRKRDRTPQRAKENPRRQPRAARASHTAQPQRQHEHPREQARRKRHLPYPVNRILQKRRIHGPQPRRPQRNRRDRFRRAPREALRVETSRGDLPDSRNDQRGEEAVRDEHENRRAPRV